MEVLLFSNDEKIFNLTNSVIDGRYKLTWCTYKSLEKKTCPYPYPDIVIMHFDKEMVKKGTFKTIVQVKGRLGQRIPIPAIPVAFEPPFVKPNRLTVRKRPAWHPCC